MVNTLPSKSTSSNPGRLYSPIGFSGVVEEFVVAAVDPVGAVVGFVVAAVDPVGAVVGFVVTAVESVGTVVGVSLFLHAASARMQQSIAAARIIDNTLFMKKLLSCFFIVQ